MFSMRNLALAALFATPALPPAHAGSIGKYDGSWSVSVVTEQGSCDAYKWTIIVQDGHLQRVDSLPVSASGAIDGHGQARFQVASVVTAVGHMSEGAGSGRWDAPSRSCSGRWQAAKL
jgi:hypothetical protein